MLVRCIKLFVTLVMVVLTFSPVCASAQTWSAAPLKTATPVPNDGLPPERAAFSAWLRGLTAAPSPTEATRSRERMYVYISELAKRSNGKFPPPSDTSHALFAVASQFGVSGADLVARALKPGANDIPTVPTPNLVLTLSGSLFRLSNEDRSWSVCYPYYFMSNAVGRQLPANGVSTEIAVLSTLFAPDESPLRSSQATIFLAAASVADSAKHVDLWLKQFAASATATPSEASSGTWFASPAADPVQRLVTIRRLPNRVMVIAYIGNKGTFEANRPHFFNLLTTLNAAKCVE